MKSSESITYKGKTYTQLPKNLTAKDYEEAIKEILSKTKKFKNTTIYLDSRKKQPAHPGISDLDFVIINDNPPKELINIFKGENISEKANYVLMHEDMFLTKNLAKNYGEVTGKNTKSWKIISGKPIKTSKSNNINLNFREIDDFVMHDIRRLCTQIFTKKVYVRRTLHILNYIHFMNTDLFTKHLNKTDTRKLLVLSKRVTKLRKNWFNKPIMKNIKEIEILLNKILQLHEKIMHSLAKYMKKYTTNIDENKIFCVKDTSYPMIFKKSKNYVQEIKRIYDKYGKIVVVLPPILFANLSEYSRYDCELSKHIKNVANECPDMIKKEYKKYFKEKIQYYDDSLQFCKKHKLEQGPIINFDLHTPSPAKIKKKITRQIRKKKSRIKVNTIIKKEI